MGNCKVKHTYILLKRDAFSNPIYFDESIEILDLLLNYPKKIPIYARGQSSLNQLSWFGKVMRRNIDLIKTSKKHQKLFESKLQFYSESNIPSDNQQSKVKLNCSDNII